MKSPNQTPVEFCKVVTAYTGEPIDKIGQLTYWNMSGTELFSFSKFYFKEVYSRFSSEELRRQQNINYRLRFVIGVMAIVILALLISKH